MTDLTEPAAFNVVLLELATFPAEDKAEVLAFQNKVARLQRAVTGAGRAVGEADSRVAHCRRAISVTPAADPALMADVRKLEVRLNEIRTKLSGDRTLSRRNEPVPPSISQRVGQAMNWNTTAAPTQTQRDAYQHAGGLFAAVLDDLRKLMEEDLKQLEDKLEAAGAPWTPGRLPKWKIE